MSILLLYSRHPTFFQILTLLYVLCCTALYCRTLVTEMIPVDHPGHASPAKYFADVLARSLCRETRARAWCEETSSYAPIKQNRCPVSLPGFVYIISITCSNRRFFFSQLSSLPGGLSSKTDVFFISSHFLFIFSGRISSNRRFFFFSVSSLPGVKKSGGFFFAFRRCFFFFFAFLIPGRAQQYAAAGVVFFVPFFQVENENAAGVSS